MDTKIKPKNIEFKELTYTVNAKKGKFFNLVILKLNFRNNFYMGLTTEKLLIEIQLTLTFILHKVKARA